MKEFADYCYCFCSTWDGDGEIYNQEGKIVWRFQTTQLIPPSIFSFRDANGNEMASIRREKRLPMARFVVVRDDVCLGTIWQQSIWRTKYRFEFEDNSKWNLRMPMFSVFARAANESGDEILIRARTRRQWFVSIGVGLESVPILAVLAFVVCKKLQDK